ncbi:tRNA 2-selenouridine synthase [Campylobacter rectus]|uniref:tRNA 2-selenouridine synthase n=1 Tax=Campylobacter rectus TaxID=203 RepID=UPI000F5FF566|nr:tRNA 2-selenouridine synthase [Campylobacter rectus]RRD51923.1 tRNA 2-selenouridine synthase [Campylobacter rectus]
MKFILSILAVLAIVFLVGCSAKDTIDNKLSNSEITKLGKKYGGVYVFNKKFEKEIDDRERERKNYMDNFFKTKKVFKKDDLKVLDNTLPQTLSNGKQYYLRSNYRGKVVIPEEVSLKIKNYIGEKAYKHCSILIEEFYIDDNEQLQVISLSLMFYVGYTKFGFFGDEGRGFSLSRKDVKTLPGNNKIYIEDLEKR